jgi:hypothetical protein
VGDLKSKKKKKKKNGKEQSNHNTEKETSAIISDRPRITTATNYKQQKGRDRQVREQDQSSQMAKRYRGECMKEMRIQITNKHKSKQTKQQSGPFDHPVSSSPRPPLHISMLSQLLRVYFLNGGLNIH